MTKPLLIAMVGLPRSGKSTVARKFSEKLGAPIVSRDAIRLVLHGFRYASEAEPMVKVIGIYMIKALFKADHKVVVYDETNWSLEAREAIQSEEWDTKFYLNYVGPETCKDRAKATGQEDLIPVIDEMWERRVPLGASFKKHGPEERFTHPLLSDWLVEINEERKTKGPKS